MGAVASLLYASNYPDRIECLILDSPFSSLQKILEDIVASYKWIPNMLGKYVYSKARK